MKNICLVAFPPSLLLLMFFNLLGNASINFIIILCSLQLIKENLSQQEYTSAFSPDS